MSSCCKKKAAASLALFIATLAPAAWAESSDAKLRQFAERLRPPAATAPDGTVPAGTAPDGTAPARTPVELTPERLKERSDLIAQGELDLSQLRVEAAQQAFEKAALMLHAADSEMALVRSYMQAGEYRRALAFGAHTAGAHLDVVGGSALYAWLLFRGGQQAAARRLLDEAAARAPGQSLIDSVQQQLASGAPSATPELLALPTRLAPYMSASGLPASALAISSGVLLPGADGLMGQYALVPLASLVSVRFWGPPARSPIAAAAPGKPGQPAYWVRNGLGQSSRAVALQHAPSTVRLARLGVALLKLATALPLPDGLAAAEKEPFAGSAAYAVEYPLAQPGQPPAPDWPQMHIGFTGGMLKPQEADRRDRLLGIGLPTGPRGGGVFNAAGQFVGLALPGGAGQPDLLVTAGQLRDALGDSAAAHGLAFRSGQPQGAAPADKIYEASLKNTLQLISAE